MTFEQWPIHFILPRVEFAKETACTEQGFLRYVLGISSPAQQPTREVESSIEVRKYQLLKAHPVFELQLTHKSPLKVRPHE